MRKSATDLDIYFVTAQDYGNVFADAFEVTVPVWNVFVRDSRRDVEHDDAALSLDVVPIPEATEFLLASGIPDVEADGTEIGGEFERVHLNTKGSWMDVISTCTTRERVAVDACQCIFSRIHRSSDATKKRRSASRNHRDDISC